jgi:hypothetical protein
MKPFGVTGENLDVKGQLVTFILGENKFKHTFLVCPLPSEAAGLFGADFLERVGANVNFDSRELSFTHDKAEPRARDDTHEGRMAHTVFLEGKEGQNFQLEKQRDKGTIRPYSFPLV